MAVVCARSCVSVHVCVCLCVLIVQWSSPDGAVWDVWKRLGGIGKEREGGAVEDTVSFSGGMSSCVFLFGEAAHGSQKLAGNHMLLTLGPIRRRRRREESGEEVGLWREGREGKGALANLQEGRLSHEMLAELEPLCMPACAYVHACALSSARGCVTKKQLLQLSQRRRVSMNPGQAPQRAAEQKPCKLRMCSVEARPNLTLC